MKNKRQCGSYWGFSTTGHIEDARSLATGSLQPLNKQQLVICDMVDSGCDGEFMNDAFAFVENAMCTKTGYSYTAIKGTCTVMIAQGGAAEYRDAFTDSEHLFQC